MTDLTLHSERQIARRGLTPVQVAYVLTYGQRLHRAGVLICFLRQRDIPIWDRANPEAARLEGVAVVLSKDGGTVITVWRNARRGLKNIRRKPKYRLCLLDEPPWG